MPRLAVIGAGISGLAAAHAARWTAAEAGLPLEVTVFERDADPGGKARTLSEEGYVVEAGPTGYLDNEPALDRLAEVAGVSKRPANAAAARRFLVRGGRMREISLNPLKFLASGILGPLGVLRIAAEPFVGRAPEGAEESILAFAERRLGSQVARRMIAPMVLGVYAGDAAALSAQAAFPRLVELEREHGSLIRAMFALKRKKRPSGGPAGPAGALTSFDGGLQQLPRALARADGITVRCGHAVEALDGGDGYRLRAGGETFEADAVVLAGESWASASLLGRLAPDAAEALERIPTPPVTVVALGYPPRFRDAAPEGFGVLIPRGEGFRILGCLWDSHLFPGREPEGHLLVRAMIGGSVDPEAAGLGEEELLRTVQADLRRLMPRLGEPCFTRIVRWERAIPQYTAGHLGRLDAVEQSLERAGGLFIAGNALHGIAFTKAAAAGVKAGEKAARWLGRRISA